MSASSTQQDWRYIELDDDEFDLLGSFHQFSDAMFESPPPPPAADQGKGTTCFPEASQSASGVSMDCFDGDSAYRDLLESSIIRSQSHEEMSDESFLPSLTDNDWFINSIFGDQDLVYNDKNLGETASQPCIKSEHSYSSNNLGPASPPPPALATKVEEPDTAVFHSQSTSSSLDSNPSSHHQQLVRHAPGSSSTQLHAIKCESPSSDPMLSAMVTSDSSPATFTHAPTIILTTTTSPTSSAVPATFSHGGQAVFPTTLHIKADPGDSLDALQEQTVSMDGMVLPPTPPSSNGSDSDGSQSPQRSAPNSPQRGSPMPQSGVLILSEEEKRTLISEGYPIPAKLPLTKQEEKNLKKVRRKIKNKISAQESRRKKKEYLEQLEKRVEAFNHENSDLKKKVESLENNNRSLLGQLHKLQAMLAKVPKTAAASATQTGTVLMVLVLCFAVFLGGGGVGGPSSLNVGYATVAKPPLLVFAGQQQPGPLRVQPNMGPGAPRAVDTAADDYTTPNLKSRVLMALTKEEPDDLCDEYRPLVPWDRLHQWSSSSCPTDMEAATRETQGDGDDGVSSPTNQPGTENVMPMVTHRDVIDAGNDLDLQHSSAAVVTIAVGAESNDTKDDYQAMMHPDIAVAPSNLGHGNFTADLETA
ncbi:uncharacterized protein LOC143283142 isoform X2 [Babylonia areolata]|uniref:uncharacterized protein LOC143283142 isoform X2 n=1 Tax=Babylonia areolata TaxID=304850 RepID=UPI003FD30EF8